MGNQCQPCVKVVLSKNSEYQVIKEITKTSAESYTFGANQKGSVVEDDGLQKIKAEFTPPKQIGDSEDSMVSIDETIIVKQNKQQVNHQPKKKLKMRRISSENQFEMMPSDTSRRISEQQLDKKYNYNQNNEFLQQKILKYHKWDGRTINQQLQQLRKVQKEQQLCFDQAFQTIGSSQVQKFQKTQSKDINSRTKSGSSSNFAFIIE